MRTLYGEPDIIEIRRIFDCSEKAKNWEYKVLRRMKVIEKSEWLNENIGTPPIMRGKNHPRYGVTTLSQKQKDSLSKQTVINGITYSSRIEAAKKLGVNRNTITKWVKNGGIPLNPNERFKKAIERNKIKTTINDIEFSSRVEAAKYYNVTATTIINWIKNGGYSYDSEETKRKRNLQRRYTKQTIINGIKYSSRKEASEKLNVSLDTIQRWIKNGGPFDLQKVQKIINDKISKPVIINGINYSSLTLAAKKLSVSKGTISYWLKTGKASYGEKHD